MTTDEVPAAPLGQLVQATAQGTTRRWFRLVVAVVSVLMVALLGLQWRVLVRLDSAEDRDRAVAGVVAAFAALASADTPAEQQAALEQLEAAKEKLPQDSPVRREVERSTTTTSEAPRGAGVTGTTETAEPPPSTAGPGSTSTTSTTTRPVFDLPPIDLPPVPLPCVPFLCARRM